MTVMPLVKLSVILGVKGGIEFRNALYEEGYCVKIIRLDVLTRIGGLLRISLLSLLNLVLQPRINGFKT